jgi:hypothetical protein
MQSIPDHCRSWDKFDKYFKLLTLVTNPLQNTGRNLQSIVVISRLDSNASDANMLEIIWDRLCCSRNLFVIVIQSLCSTEIDTLKRSSIFWKLHHCFQKWEECTCTHSHINHFILLCQNSLKCQNMFKISLDHSRQKLLCSWGWWAHRPCKQYLI